MKKKNTMDMTLLPLVICTAPVAKWVLRILISGLSFKNLFSRLNFHRVICSPFAVSSYLGQSVPKAICSKVKMFHLSAIWHCRTVAQ